MQATGRPRKGALTRICEIYASVQGEGLLTGSPSVFVRTSGCNLRCWFCDTVYASWQPQGDYFTVDEIVEQVVRHEPRCVVVTGGEPMIFETLCEMCERLSESGRHITIETAGTRYLPLRCDLISISPKLSRSGPGAQGAWQRLHHARRERLDVVRMLMSEHPYQLKFVVDSLADAHEVLEYLEKLGTFASERVLLMPQGTETEALLRQAQWLVPWCEEHSFRYCPRAHIFWFGHRRGT